MKMFAALTASALLTVGAGQVASAQAPARPKACTATVGAESGPFANAIALILPDGKIVPYKMMYRSAAGRVQMDSRRPELKSRTDRAELSLVYGLRPSQQGLDVQLEDVRIQTPTVFGPGPLPGDKLREVVTQLSVGAAATVTLEPDHVQPIDRGLLTINPAKAGKGVAILDRETLVRLARAVEGGSSIHLVGQRVGSSGTSAMDYYAADLAIGTPAERGAMLQQVVREAAARASTHPEQCS